MSEYLDKHALVELGPLDSDDIPLRQALAMFISDDINEGGKIITRLINDESKKYQKIDIRNFNIFFIFAILAMISFLISTVFSKIYPVVSNGSVILTMIFLFFAIFPRIQMKSFQYGKDPEAPLDLPHETDERIDAFLEPLQNEFKLKTYYYSARKKKRIPLEHKQFFSRLRYLLFSEHPHIRRLVLLYSTAMASPQGIFMRRSDLEKMIEDSKPEPEAKPKRQGGPGRKPSPRYADGLIGLIGNQKLLQFDVSDEAQAKSDIAELLIDWFKTREYTSAWTPRNSEIAPYVEKIYAHLKNLARPQ